MPVAIGLWPARSLCCCRAWLRALHSPQDAKLLADCAAPQRVVGSADAAPNVTATVGCEVRSTDAVAFKGVKASVKGRSEPLEADFKGFDARSNSLVGMFLIQILEPARRATLTQMADAVVKIAEQRDGNRRLAAYSFANDLNLLADFDASKRDFERQVRAVRAAALPSQLYKTSLDAIAKLAKERADRKALIILGDGQSDDTADEHDQVVRAAKEAGVTIHALGFLANAADSPKFQALRRLADETGGFRREVRTGGAQRYTVNNRFVGEALENGGSLKITLKEPPGPATVVITASLADGRSESIERTFTLAAPPASPAVAPAAAQPGRRGPRQRAGGASRLAWAAAELGAGQSPACRCRRRGARDGRGRSDGAGRQQLFRRAAPRLPCRSKRAAFMVGSTCSTAMPRAILCGPQTFASAATATTTSACKTIRSRDATRCCTSMPTIGAS